MFTLSKNFSRFLQKPAIRTETAKHLLEVADLIAVPGTEMKDIENTLKHYRIDSIDHVKIESIDLLISYAHFILEDSVITETEAYDFEALKRIFRIREGEFLRYRGLDVREILRKEFLRIYSDAFVDRKEEIEKVNLQALFDLSYDQFQDIMKDDVIAALLNGAHPQDLDIAVLPKGFRMDPDKR